MSDGLNLAQQVVAGSPPKPPFNSVIELAFAWLMPLVRLFLMLFFSSILQAAMAQSGQITIDRADHYVLSESYTFMEDKSAKLTFEQVLRPEVQARFAPLVAGASATNFGLTRSAIWLRITLDANAPAPARWLLEVAYPPLDEIDLYVPRPDGGFDRQLGGDSRLFAERRVSHRNHIFPIALQPGKAMTVHLRVASLGTVAVPSQLWQPEAFATHTQSEYSMLSLYFGLLIGLFLYNLLLFISLRERVYFYYVAFVFWIAMSQSALTGIGTQFLWPEWAWWVRVSIGASNSASGVFAILFARNFLSSRLTMPRLDRFLQLQIIFWLLSLASALFLPYIIAVWTVTILSAITVTSLVVIGLLSVRKKTPGAIYFVGAWAVFLLGVAGLILHNTGFLPSNQITANSMMIGSAFEMVLLSFGLAYRINVAIAEKEQAQAKSNVNHAMVEALSQSQERYRTVLQERETILAASIVGIVFLTADGRFRWANQAMLDIFGVPDLPITSMEQFYQSRQEYLRVGAEAAASIGRGEVYQTEIQVKQLDGTLIWISLSGKAVVERDLAQGTVWVTVNITQRKLLEAELSKASSEREAILNSALIGIVLSVNRKHQWVNDKFLGMVGYSREELIGFTSVRIHPNRQSWEDFERIANDTLLASSVCTVERRLRRENGELFWVQMGGSCIEPNNPDAGVIWTFLDITQRKQSEHDTHEALEQQKELNELRSRFVTIASHEFRTPLAIIFSSQELLRDFGDRLPAHERADIFKSIAAGVQRMTNMLDRVLLIGKADAQMLEFKPRLIDLKSLCLRLLEEAESAQTDTHCTVELRFSGGTTEGWYDEKLLRHVVSNLLSNAIKYSPQGGDVCLALTVAQDMTVLAVSDEGIGIPHDEIGHLFESFHRASNVGTIHGTGLGLAIVKNAVTVHGGTIEVDSTVGRGTCFTVRLPVAGTQPD